MRYSVLHFLLISPHISLVPLSFSNITKKQAVVTSAVGVSTCAMIVVFIHWEALTDSKLSGKTTQKANDKSTGILNAQGSSSLSSLPSASLISSTSSPTSLSPLSSPSASTSKDQSKAQLDASASEGEERKKLKEQLAKLQAQLDAAKQKSEDLKARLDASASEGEERKKLKEQLAKLQAQINITRQKQSLIENINKTPRPLATVPGNESDWMSARNKSTMKDQSTQSDDNLGSPVTGTTDGKGSSIPLGEVSPPSQGKGTTKGNGKGKGQGVLEGEGKNPNEAGNANVTQVAKGKGKGPPLPKGNNTGKGKGPPLPQGNNTGKGKGSLSLGKDLGEVPQCQRLDIIDSDEDKTQVIPNAHAETEDEGKSNPTKQLSEKLLLLLGLTVRTAPCFSSSLAEWIRQNLDIVSIEESLSCIQDEICETIKRTGALNDWFHNQKCQYKLRQVVYNALSLIPQNILKDKGNQLVDIRSSNFPYLSDLSIMLQKYLDKADQEKQGLTFNNNEDNDLVFNNTEYNDLTFNNTDDYDLMRGALGVISAFTGLIKESAGTQFNSTKSISLDEDLKSMSLKAAPQGTDNAYKVLEASLEKNKHFTSSDPYFFLHNIQKLANHTSDVTGFQLNNQSVPSASMASGGDCEKISSAEQQESELEILNVKYQKLIKEEDKVIRNTPIKPSKLVQECIHEGFKLPAGNIEIALLSETISKSEDIHPSAACNVFSPAIIDLYTSVSNMNQGCDNKNKDHTKAFTVECIQKETNKVSSCHKQNEQIDKKGRHKWLICNNVFLKLDIKGDTGIKNAKKILERFTAMKQHFENRYNQWIESHIGYFVFINRQDIVDIGKELRDFKTTSKLDALLFQEICCKFYEKCQSIKADFDIASNNVRNAKSIIVNIQSHYQKIRNNEHRLEFCKVYAQCKMFIDEVVLSVNGRVEGNSNLYSYLFNPDINVDANRQLSKKETHRAINKQLIEKMSEIRDFIKINESSTAPEFKILSDLMKDKCVELIELYTQTLKSNACKAKTLQKIKRFINANEGSIAPEFEKLCELVDKITKENTEKAKTRARQGKIGLSVVERSAR